MTDDLAAIVRDLQDRRDIHDCLMRYCRGLDRLDRDLVRSAYHDGAIDDHGDFVGPVEGFLDHVFAFQTTAQLRTQHHITNHVCEIDGDVAHAESYFLFRSHNAFDPIYFFASGRYVDRFEKRAGRWGIVERVCIVEVRDEGVAPTGTEEDGGFFPPRRDPRDVSYQRPLRVVRARFTSSAKD